MQVNNLGYIQRQGPESVPPKPIVLPLHFTPPPPGQDLWLESITAQLPWVARRGIRGRPRPAIALQKLPSEVIISCEGLVLGTDRLCDCGPEPPRRSVQVNPGKPGIQPQNMTL